MAVPVISRIVVGVNGSAESVCALGWACREASLRSAEVHAVHVWETPCHGTASYAAASRFPDAGDRADKAQAILWRAVRMVDSVGVPVRAEMAEGLAARVLLERANGADMLVLGAGTGSGAASGDDAFRSAGPVLRACVRRAPCPVVVIGLDDSADLRSRGVMPVPVGAWS